MKCCGRFRRTKFCPECGKQFPNDDVLWGLLSHCQQSIQMLETSIESYSSGAKQVNENIEETRRSGLEEAIVKWSAWEFELTKILNDRHQQKMDGG